MVQNELIRRGDIRWHSDNNKGRFSSKYPFSKKIVCGECGDYFRRHAQTIKGKYSRTWVCATHKLEGNEKCSQKYIKECDIEKAFLEVIQKLVNDFQTIKVTLRENIISSLESTDVADLTRF